VNTHIRTIHTRIRVHRTDAQRARRGQEHAGMMESEQEFEEEQSNPLCTTAASMAASVFALCCRA
jgi:hypothetical protein